MECSRIAGYLLEISLYNSRFLCVIFFSVVLVLHSTVHLLASAWPLFVPWVVVFCQPQALKLLEISSLVFCLYPCRAPRPTNSFKSVYLLLPTASNKENDLSSIILIPDLWTEVKPSVVSISMLSINCVWAGYLKVKHHKARFNGNLLLYKWKYPFHISLSIYVGS